MRSEIRDTSKLQSREKYFSKAKRTHRRSALALDRGAPGGESGGDDPTLLVNLVLLSNES
jgi:hypothetical protein